VDKERAWKILDVMTPIAKAHGCSPARLSIAWLLVKPAVIIGVKRLDQFQDNLAAIKLSLTQDELRQLDEVTALRLRLDVNDSLPRIPAFPVAQSDESLSSWMERTACFYGCDLGLWVNQFSKELYELGWALKIWIWTAATSQETS
jgi:hypothetical protein